MLQWLGEIQAAERNILNSLLQESQEFLDEDLEDFCDRHLRLSTSIGGKRAKLMAQVAMKDDPAKDSSERRATDQRAPEAGP